MNMTDEMVEIARKAADEINGGSSPYFAILDAFAALSVPPAGVVVKPLEWRDNTKGGCLADTQLGCYAAIWNGGKFYQACFNGVTVDHEYHRTLEAAKDAAFADYSARVMSAIEPAGVTPSQDGLLVRLTEASAKSARLADAADKAFVKGLHEDGGLKNMSAIEPAGVGVETEAGWIKITGNLPHEVATTITEKNQVLAYERGRYFNAWLIFDEYEGGWCWKDEADSEPSPSHYRWLREVALKGDEQ